MYENVVYALVALFDLVILVRLFNVLFDEKRVTPLNEIVYFIGYFLFMFFSLMLIESIVFHYVIVIIGVFLFSLLYKSTLSLRLLNINLVAVIMIVADSFVTLMYQPLELSYIATSLDVELVIDFITTRVLTFVAVLYFEKITIVKKGVTLPMSYWVAITVVPVASLFLTIVLALSIPYEWITVFAVGFIFFLDGFVFYIYDKQVDMFTSQVSNEILLQQNEAYVSQLKLMEESIKNIRAIKHDIKNHLTTLQGFADKNDTSGMLKYLEDTKVFVEDELVIHTGNTAMDSLVNYKYAYAKSLGIDLELNVGIPKEINIDIFDLSTIVGNLLDNAIEAVSECEMKKVYFTLKFDRGVIYINSTNHFNRQFENNKPRHGRGIGLKNIKSIVNKHNGVFDSMIEDDLFKIALLLYTE